MLNAIAVKISRYTAVVFPFSLFARAFAGLGLVACAACVNVASRPEAAEAPLPFYTVTGEIALSRHEPRLAALQYAAAAETSRDVGLLQRAAEVTAATLQPTLSFRVATRWIDVDPGSVEAHRAAAKAALELFKIEQSTAHYRVVLNSSPRGFAAEFATLDEELSASDNVHGARQLADRLAAYFPASAEVLRLQAHTALRADDPAAAVRSFNALEALGSAADPDMTQSLWRARILAGDVQQPLAESQSLVAREPTAANRLGHALLLLAAQQNDAARVELVSLTQDPAAAPAALHLLGLIDFQDGRLDDAGSRFAQLVVTGKYLDDALYYLGLIAERHQDLERALRLYAQVQEGDNTVPALLRAAGILRAHGAAPAAEELLDRLVEEVPARAPEILAARARIYADAGEPPQAQAVLDRAVLEYPDSVQLEYAVASLAEERGHLATALHELRAVAKRRPDDPAALNAYGYTLADHNRHLGRAHELIERAYACAPKNAAILDSFGWVLFRQGRGEDALAYLNAAYADDRGGDIAAHLGEVLWHLGRRTDAESIWSEGSRNDAENALLKATRVRLHASN
jgi:tetratricopeptide (TPR) repeat protein